MRNFPHGVRWHPRLGGRTAEYEPVRARAQYRCRHVDVHGWHLAGPCVGRIKAGEMFVRVEHSARTHTRLAMRCAVLAEIVVDERLTPPLIETLLCARGGILLWMPEVVPHFVFVLGDNGNASHSPVAEVAALWLHRHGYVRIPTNPGDARILATAAGLAAVEGWKRESVASRIP